MAAGAFHVPLISPPEFPKAKINAIHAYPLPTRHSLANLSRTTTYLPDMIQPGPPPRIGSLANRLLA